MNLSDVLSLFEVNFERDNGWVECNLCREFNGKSTDGRVFDGVETSYYLHHARRHFNGDLSKRYPLYQKGDLVYCDEYSPEVHGKIVSVLLAEGKAYVHWPEKGKQLWSFDLLHRA